MVRRIVLVGASAAVALVVLLLHDDGRESPTLENAVSSAGPRKSERLTPEADAAQRVTLPGASAVAPREASRGATPAEGVSLRVVRATDGEPVPGALVLYLDEQRADPVELARFRREVASGFAAVARRFGSSTRTDGRGRALVPWPRESVHVGCAHAGLWGELEIQADATGEQELRLEPVDALVVRVVDAAGNPVAGAAVVVRSRAGSARAFERMLEVTDARGRAQFEHLRFVSVVGDVTIRFFVGLRLLVREPVEVELDPADLPRAPVTLVLPATGSVELELVGADGALVSESTVPGSTVPVGGTVSLGLSETSRYDLATAGHEGVSETTFGSLAQGRVRFDHVGLGLSLSAFAWPHGWNAGAVTARGPTASGETIAIRIPVDAPAPVLVGRALDGDGRPLANRTLTCEFWHGELARSPWWTEHIVSDAEGRFGGLGRGFLEEAPAWSIRLRTRGDGPELVAEHALPFPMPVGEVALGDVVFSAPPVVVSGSVVDEAGAPVARARVSLQRAGQEPRERRLRWVDVPGASAFSDGAGAFELRALVHSGPLRLQARAEGMLPAEREVLGSLPAIEHLVLVRGGTLEGRLIVPSGRVVDWVDVHLSGAGGRPVPITWLEDGSFRCSGLAGGTYELTLLLWNDHSHPLEIGGIVVVPAAPGRDPRLDPLRLAELVHGHRLRVRNEAGGALDEAILGLGARGTEGWFEPALAPPRDGLYTVHSFRDPLPRVRVRAPGYRPEVVENVSGEVSVQLRRGLAVRLVTSDALPSMKGGWQLLASLGNDAGDAQGVFDAHGHAVLQLEQPGNYGLVLLLRRELNGKEWSRRSLGTFDAFFEVLESAEEQVFTVPPVPEWLLARLRSHLDEP